MLSALWLTVWAAALNVSTAAKTAENLRRVMPPIVAGRGLYLTSAKQIGSRQVPDGYHIYKNIRISVLLVYTNIVLIQFRLDRGRFSSHFRPFGIRTACRLLAATKGWAAEPQSRTLRPKRSITMIGIGRRRSPGDPAPP